MWLIIAYWQDQHPKYCLYNMIFLVFLFTFLVIGLCNFSTNSLFKIFSFLVTLQANLFALVAEVSL